MPLDRDGITVTASSVDARWDDLDRSLKVRVIGSIIAVAFAVLVFSITLFYGHGTSLWGQLINGPRNSVDFVMALALVAFWSGLSVFLIFVAARNWFPSGEALHCDRSTFAVSNIGWFNLRGQWVTRAFPLKEISQVQFTVVQRGRGAKVYGIKFFANGKKQKLFSFIAPPDANVILKGLENLGVDVRHDLDTTNK